MWTLRHDHAVKVTMVMIMMVVWSRMEGTYAIRFVIDRSECLSHEVKYEGDSSLHVSFVVVKAETTWHFRNEGVDLSITGPNGESIHEFRDKTSEKYEIVIHHKGVYSFCFTNKGPYHETIEFDIQEDHFGRYDQHAKNEHFEPLLEQISKLDRALKNVQFEQNWIEAENEHWEWLNNLTNRITFQKVVYESVAMIGASLLQVYLLKRLFKRRLGISK